MSDEELKKRLLQLEQIVGTLIVWIAQSSNAPLSTKDAEELLKRLKMWTTNE